MAWTVVLSRRAEKSLPNLPEQIRAWALGLVAALHNGPNVQGAEKLTGPGKRFKVRKGDYRLTFEVKDGRIEVARIGHRKDVYRE